MRKAKHIEQTSREPVNIDGLMGAGKIEERWAVQMARERCDISNNPACLFRQCLEPMGGWKSFV